MRKTRLCSLILAAAQVLTLASCGGGSEPIPSSQPVEPPAPSASISSSDPKPISSSEPIDPLTAAENAFHSVEKALSDTNKNLSHRIPEAETLIETLTEEDVLDPWVIEELKASMEEAKMIEEVEIPEIGSNVEEIQVQTQIIQEYADRRKAIYDALNAAVSQVKKSQQDLIRKKKQDSAALKQVCVKQIENGTGYVAECTVSLTDWIKASDTELLQSAWSNAVKTGETMPAISYFHSNANDGFTEASAAVVFGTISFRNITEGFDITQENPTTFRVQLGAYITQAGYRAISGYIMDSKAYVLFNPPRLEDGRAFHINPIMKGNTWGPVAFMIVCPNVFTPKYPNGEVLKDKDKFGFGVNGENVSPATSW